MVRFILPVKGLNLGKSRLRVPAAQRSALVTAMLQDCLNAVRETGLGPAVVVSPDPAVLALADAAGAEVLDHAGDLNVAISAAATQRPCAALLPDLPALRAAELVAVLTEHPAGFVPDAAGTGTTLLFGASLRPRFGPGSAQRHAEAGYRRVDLPMCGLSADVDTWEDLLRVRRLGLGRHTADVLGSLEPPGVGDTSPAGT